MAADRTEFPAIDSSFRFHPYPSTFTPTRGALPTDGSALSSYPSKETFVITRLESTLITSIYAEPSTSMASTSTGDPPVSTTPASETSTQGLSSMNKGAKIGIAVGIAVTVVLTLLIVVIVAADFRRRRRRKTEAQRRDTQDSELSLWEAELKKNRAGEPTPTTNVEITGSLGKTRDGHSEPTSTREEFIPGRHGSVSSSGRTSMGTRDVNISGRHGSVSDVGEREWAWQPAYMPKERYSIGNMSVPIINPATRSSLDGLGEKTRPFR